MYGYQWTEEYGIFRLSIDVKLQKEIRPVFHEELDYFGMDAFWDYPKDTDAPLLWAEGIRRYVMNGVCVAEARGGGFYSKPVIHRLTEDRLRLQPVDTQRLYEVNRSLMLSLEQKAVHFIQEQYAKFQPHKYAFVCAFSGGKDSLVLLDLMAKALAPDDFFVIFSNTGMELPDTLRSVECAKEHWSQLSFKEAQSHMTPEESWDIFGPPANKLRWCCSVHKSVPTIIKLRELLNQFNVKAVVFDGIRAEESARRKKYPEVSIGAKNISQINVSPIHKWNNAEIYCFLFKNNIFFNNAYRNGMFRVGCMVCPMSSDWWDSIIGQRYSNEAQPLRDKIEQYVAGFKSKARRKHYIESGGWKSRLGGRNLPNGGNRVSEIIQKNHISFSIPKVSQDWIEVAKILGVVSESGQNYGVQRIDGINYEYRITAAEDVFSIQYYPFSQMNRYVISHLRCVANKVAYCKGCKACVVQCPTGAFTIQPDGKILVQESRCIHCYNCMTFSDKGCILAHSLSTTQGGSGMNLKGMNAYQNFGFQQSFLEHFMEYGVSCFARQDLGNRQYDSLKRWLEHSNIIEISAKDRSISVTELGKKLIDMGAYLPLTWAIIWANLSYNSIICKWYCLNAEIGATYELGDIVALLGDTYSQTTRKNAAGSLLATFRHSPIGASIQQGMPTERGKNVYAYLRTGWELPHAAALLYTLYLYGEHTGKRAFTFTELANAHNHPDAAGISPSDIYGLELHAFRDAVQGLAVSFPDFLRVSFISNLDNIILLDHTSLDVLDLAKE